MQYKIKQTVCLAGVRYEAGTSRDIGEEVAAKLGANVEQVGAPAPQAQVEAEPQEGGAPSVAENKVPKRVRRK